MNDLQTNSFNFNRPAILRPGVFGPTFGGMLTMMLVGLAVFLFGLSLAVSSQVNAQLAFSPDCRAHQLINVAPPNNAILLSKHPVPHRNGEASVYDIDADETYRIVDGQNSCVIAAPDPGDSYCFIARNDPTILQVGAGAIVNPPVCANP
ncbi:hypothetical protein J0X15_07990 [Roseibium sp. CAU 1637]|uniref:Uncharacterized protein n=1 Tax=Roseibium limicola TaxID=2816037 RepID=A0A939J8B9_9HYPH|nr:hypothetical protein [Roseibium limicola]MBO0345156.1 hypothetical protein [Roseibium limicola]